MAGYSGLSMSNNAVSAYEEGKLPISKVTRKKLDEHGISIPVNMFKWLCRKGIIRSCEWHHTSMDYNETYFYDLADAAKILATRDMEALKKNYRKQMSSSKPGQKKENIIRYARVVYEVPVGLGKKRKYHSYEEYAVILNDWAYLVSGGKKFVKGKRFNVAETFDVRPEQIAKSLADEVREKIKP